MRAEDVRENDRVYREVIQAALAAYDAGDLEKAHALFQAAYARYPNARVLRGLGTVELEQHDYASAATHLEEALASPELPLGEALRQETVAALSEANAHVGRVTVLPSPAEAKIRLDGRPVEAGRPVALAAGAHMLELSAEGFRGERRQIFVAPNQRQLVHWSLEHAVLEPVAPRTPIERTHEPERLGPWLTIGSGGALAITGLALLASGVHDYRHLDDASSYANWRDERARYPKLAGIGGALAGVGAVAIASGWWWRIDARKHLKISLLPDGVQLQRAF